MEIVPLDQIPNKRDVIDVPKDDLMQVYNVCLQMEEVCKNNSGIGLSAVQVGIPWRLFVICKEGTFEYYVDCEYSGDSEDLAPSVEGCLSIRNSNGACRTFMVKRHESPLVKGYKLVANDTLELEPFDEVIHGLYGVVLQHEIDHQDGILISDIGTEMDITTSVSYS